MLLTGAGCGLIAFILCLSGIHGQTHICALRGSSVNLTCSTKNLPSRNKWFNEHRKGLELVYKELSADDRHVIHTSNENRPTLTIRNLTKSDANVYCCGNTTEDPEACRHRSVQLSVADLQVKVIPAMSEQRENNVKLMCRTSCGLTESPAAYIWYRNKRALAEDKTFYYENLRHRKVKYSCAVKGYEKLRAPEVLLDFSNPKCLKVTHAKGKMCSSQNKSEDGSCSITYPIDLQVKVSPVISEHRESSVKLTCSTNCDLTESPGGYIWYRNKRALTEDKIFCYANISMYKNVTYTCAVKGYEKLKAPEVLLDFSNPKCLKVAYAKEEMGSAKNKSEDESCLITYSLEPKSDRNKMDTDLTAAAAGASAALLVVILAIIFIWIRTKRTLDQPSTTGDVDITAQLDSGPVYNNICAPPTLQEEHHYGRLVFSEDHTEDLYSTMNETV